MVQAKRYVRRSKYPIQELIEGIKAQRNHPFLRIFSTSTFIFGIAAGIILYSYTAILDEIGTNVEQSTIRGILNGSSNIINFIIPLLQTYFLIQLMSQGSLGNFFILGIATRVISFFGFFLLFLFTMAATADFTRQIQQALLSPAAISALALLPKDIQSRSLSLNLGIISQLGIIVAGLFLLPISQFLNLSPFYLLIIVALLILLRLYFNFQMNKYYMRTLGKNLLSNELDISSISENLKNIIGNEKTFEFLLQNIATKEEAFQLFVLKQLSRLDLSGSNIKTIIISINNFNGTAKSALLDILNQENNIKKMDEALSKGIHGLFRHFLNDSDSVFKYNAFEHFLKYGKEDDQVIIHWQIKQIIEGIQKAWSKQKKNEEPELPNNLVQEIISLANICSKQSLTMYFQELQPFFKFNNRSLREALFKFYVATDNERAMTFMCRLLTLREEDINRENPSNISGLIEVLNLNIHLNHFEESVLTTISIEKNALTKQQSNIVRILKQDHKRIQQSIAAFLSEFPDTDEKRLRHLYDLLYFGGSDDVVYLHLKKISDWYGRLKTFEESLPNQEHKSLFGSVISIRDDHISLVQLEPHDIIFMKQFLPRLSKYSYYLVHSKISILKSLLISLSLEIYINYKQILQLSTQYDGRGLHVIDRLLRDELKAKKDLLIILLYLQTTDEARRKLLMDAGQKLIMDNNQLYGQAFEMLSTLGHRNFRKYVLPYFDKSPINEVLLQIEGLFPFVKPNVDDLINDWKSLDTMNFIDKVKKESSATLSQRKG